MATSRYQRMIAIPEHEYSQSREMQQVMHPMKTEMASLMSDYQQHSSLTNPQTRVQMQGETLEQMIKLKDGLRQNVRNATPRPYQSRADGLMNFMVDKLKFNEKGELHDESGNVIHSSNIVDLIQHAVRDRRRKMTPTGWEYFIQKLSDVNAPQMLLNYDTLEEMRNKSNPNKKKVAEILSETKTLKKYKKEVLSDNDDDGKAAFRRSFEKKKPAKKRTHSLDNKYLPITTDKTKRKIKKPARYL